MLIWKVRRKIWWTSVAHYMVPYGITMMCMGWSLRWLESGRFRFLIGDLLGMAYLGGAGYPEVVLAAVWFFLCKGIPDLLLFAAAGLGISCLVRAPVIYAEQHPDILRKSGHPIEGYACVLVLFLCALFYRHIIGGTVDYTCIRYVQSGALADYREQMEEWLSILEVCVPRD